MRALCFALLLGAHLPADIYMACRVTTGYSAITTYTWGQKGNARMQETGKSRNRQISRQIFIWNDDRKTAYRVDPDAKEYNEPPKMDLLASLTRWIAPPKNHGTGKTVDIYYETIDMGQRRQILGYTARYLRVRERHVAASGACDRSSLREDEGWYVPLSERLPDFDAVYEYYTGESYRCQDIVTKHGDPRSPGLLVLRNKEDSTFEVIALSTARLDAGLFRSPPVISET